MVLQTYFVSRFPIPRNLFSSIQSLESWPTNRMHPLCIHWRFNQSDPDQSVQSPINPTIGSLYHLTNKRPCPRKLINCRSLLSLHLEYYVDQISDDPVSGTKPAGWPLGQRNSYPLRVERVGERSRVGIRRIVPASSFLRPPTKRLMERSNLFAP